MMITARTLNPRVETLVRTRSEVESELWTRETESQVFWAENELARSMSGHVLARYGR